MNNELNKKEKQYNKLLNRLKELNYISDKDIKKEEKIEKSIIVDKLEKLKKN